jgi:NADH-quinone oxidoreductase subunit M
MRELGGLAAKLPWVVTMFVITTLSIVGLPMLNSFVGEFLILSGSMQTSIAHRHFWTALATTGVILSAAYMLSMIQRVFYSGLGPTSMKIEAGDLAAREHLAMWPMVVLFLVMGVASPIWMRSIDIFGAGAAGVPAKAAAIVPPYDTQHPGALAVAKEIR